MTNVKNKKGFSGQTIFLFCEIFYQKDRISYCVSSYHATLSEKDTGTERAPTRCISNRGQNEWRYFFATDIFSFRFFQCIIDGIFYYRLC